MTYRTIKQPGGLGYDVSYYNDKTGQQGVAEVGTGPNCGNAVAMQFMLWNLGYYDGPIDGNVGPETRAGLVAFGLSKGIMYDPQTTPSGAICQALIDDHSAWQSTPPTAEPGQCPDGQWGVPPYCFGEPTPQRPEGAGTCPEGTVGLPPYCVSMPGYTGAPPPAQATTCPEGQIGYPPNCYGLPTGVPAVPGIPGTVPGIPTTPPVPGLPKPAVPPMTTPPPTTGPPTVESGGWWAERSSGEKLLVVAGGALVALSLFALIGGTTAFATSKRKAYQPNRRKRRARKNLRRATKVRRRRRAPADGKILTLRGGRRFGRGIPAKKYRKLGFVRKSQYAWPAGYMYPIGDYKHCKTAVSRYQKYKGSYPPAVRKVIAHNLLVCAPRVGMSLSPATEKSLLKDAKLKRPPKQLTK